MTTIISVRAPPSYSRPQEVQAMDQSAILAEQMA